MLGGGWTEVVALAAAYVIAVLATPAALASTFVTSVAGVITFMILSVHHHGPVAPDWPTGIALGAGGWRAPTPAPASSPGCPMP